MVAEYVIKDRTLSTRWSITIDNGGFLYTATSNSTSAEPILKDRTTSNYFQVFISSGEAATTQVATVQNDIIELYDSTLNKSWRLIVSDKKFGFMDTDSQFNFYINKESGVERKILFNSII